MSLSPPGAAPPSRLMQVDVLRGAAILLVLFRHDVVPSYQAGILAPLVRHLYYFSATGIDLFFVLSGFLIGGLLFKEVRSTGRLDVRRFLVRRILRIWPGYFVFLGFLAVRLARRGDYTLQSALGAIVPNLLHLQNYLGSPRGITWSLAVQEHFYLVLPLFILLLVCGRRPRPSLIAIPITAAFLTIACTAMRVAFNWNRPYVMWTHLTPTHLRIDSLFFGVLLAYLYHLHHSLLAAVGRYRATLLAIGAAMIAPALFIDEGSIPFSWTIAYTLLYFGYGCILVAFIFSSPDRGILGRTLASRVAAGLAYVGVFTYSIYLWHYDLGWMTVHNYLLRRLPHGPAELYWAAGMASYFVLAIAVGILMAKLIEVPVIHLRDRLLPARATAVRSSERV